MDMRVGFIGLGNTGFPMAQNIQKAGFDLCIYNRTKEKAEPLLMQGAKWCATPAELASQCDIVVSMVSNDEVCKEIAEGLFKGLKMPSIHISMSTISPDLCDALEKQHREKGIIFLAAPVTGRPERAQEASLWIFLAGDVQAQNRVTPVLQAMSQKIFDLGVHPRQAALFKLCNSFMILGFVELFSEASSLLEKNGISVEKAAEIFGSSLFNAPVLHAYKSVFSSRNFEAGGFALDLGLKDMRMLSTSADKAQVPMPVLSELHEKLLASINLGREKFDWSAIMLLAREQAGLK